LGLALDEQKNDDDLLVEAHGAKVVYSKDLEDYVSGLTLDYGDKWYNKGFRLYGSGYGSC
jgi:Fe-S cluster assembly iron-binding protein IscA